jgi:hypothetical protein
MNRTGNVPLRHMSDLMGDNASEFVFTAGCVDQASVYPDIASRQRERVNTRIVDNEKRKFVIAIVGLRCDAVADVIDVLGYLRVFDELSTHAYAAHDGAPNLRFLRLVQDGVRRTTHVRNLDIVGTGPADKDHGGNGEQRQSSSGEINDQQKLSK